MEGCNNFIQQELLMSSLDDNYFNDFNFDQYGFNYSESNSSSYPNHHHHLNTQIDQIIENQPAKQPNSNSWSGSAKANSSKLISFQNSNSPDPFTSKQHCYGLGYTSSTVKPNTQVVSDGITSNFPIACHYHNMNIINTTHQGSRSGVKRVNGAMRRSSTNAQNHVIAERNRREKLSQKFTALSALLPGLKKVPTY